MKIYTTSVKEKFSVTEVALSDRPKAEMTLIKLYPEEKKQEVLGFGGAFTESSAYVWKNMSKNSQEKLMNLYFGPDSNKYNLCRAHIQSCDFSLGNRSYVEEGASDLTSFSVEKDKEFIIPFIQAALEKEEGIEILASPWSPPAYMKTNKEMNHGGKLLKEFYGMWADIMVQYVLEYKKLGIRISRLTIQNEPAAVQSWDSCIYSGQEERELACEYLKDRLVKAGLEEVKIHIWDHNKDLIIERTKETFSDQKALNTIDGIAFHWYSGDHFEALQCVREKYPDKELIFTEGCVEYSRYQDKGQTHYAEMYAHSLIGDFNAGMNGFIDWNLILDEKGGPNHVENFCDAPVMCNPTTDEIDIKLSYYYIGHFSRFVKPGAKRILSSKYTKNLECCAFENPDGEIVLIVLNQTNETQEFELLIGQKACRMSLQPHSIITACHKE